MIVAEFAGKIIAESHRTIFLDQCHYFPETDVDLSMIHPSETTDESPEMGTAYYFDVVVGEERAHDAAWTYSIPKPAAKHIKGYIAFCGGVHVHEM